MNTSKRNFWLTPNGLGAIAIIASLLYLLLAEHRAHFIYALPWLIFLLCPLMHIFMHGGHGGHGGHDDSSEHNDLGGER